ncbi:hypothetical protein MLD38_025903 [Melastoma candidum]|uniref:Uncharacterized protein n=1 Tax=Melastoma candidum TaxID=119954 RepID=A0ACB9NWR7_9MYRT|nr:hypothetical protein MLD38_025903 [Melastoma candidum]
MDLSDAVVINSTRLKSVVWTEFDKVKKGDVCVAVCRHCKKKLNGSSTSGTSHLRNHLIRCQRRSGRDVSQYVQNRERKRERADRSLAITNHGFNQEAKREDGLSLVNIKFESDQIKEETVNAASGGFDPRRSQFDLARMIILHGYPLNMVEHVGFKVFVKNLQPLFELVTLNKLEADCLEIYYKEKQKVAEVLERLPGRICLSIEMWDSKENDSKYFCLAGHFIDENWQIRKKLLCFTAVDSSHTEDMQAHAVILSLVDWRIDQKLFSMTCDGSSSSNIITRIRECLSETQVLFANGQLFHIQCVASVINEMVEDALEEAGEVIRKIWDSIRYVKSSLALEEKFQKVALEEGIDSAKSLCLDNRIRWNSTYKMLEVALDYKGAFSVLRGQDLTFTEWPTDMDWERAGALTGFLNVFLEVSSDFSRSKYTTANIFFALVCDVHLKLIGWCKSSDSDISSLALKMKSKFDNYWGKCNLGLAIAAFLDPRFKMKLAEYYFPQIYGSSAQEHVDSIFHQIRVLYDEHSLGSPVASCEQGTTWQVGSSTGLDMNDRLMGFDKYLHETSQNDGIKADLDKYLEEPLFPRNVEFNVLNWWKVHTPRYPVLSMMARNILAIPMSNLTSESVFDMGGRVLDRDRCSLSPVVLQALMCSQDWIQSELES